MSNNDCISILLNIQDKNIKFKDNSIKEVIIKGKRTIVVKGYLDEKIVKCPHCSGENIVKNGTKKGNIKIPKISELNAILCLSKQRYFCETCNSYYTSHSNIVNTRCHISNNIKYSVINQAKEITTNKCLARHHNISHDSVQRFIDTVYSTDKLYKHYLPLSMCFDEFTYQRGKMAFNMCNASTGKTIDIVLDRSIDNLEKYFGYYSKECRSKVKYIVIDMYKPYITLIKDMFPNCNIIIDRFHLVQLISRSLNKTRIKIMKKDKENYRKYKRYWRLLLTSRFDLKCSSWKKYLCFKNLMTEVDIVDYLINTSDELKESYSLYQNLLYAIQRNDYDLLVKILYTEYSNISSYMIITINTLKEFLPYIKNTLENNYSNGIMERNNNTIKLIKRVSFGFRNFMNFKARILIITSLFRYSKKTNQFSSISP